MKTRMGRSSGKIFGRAMLLMACGVLVASAAHGQASRPGVARPLNQGVVEGYVYWSATLLQYSHSAPCQGLAATVRVLATGGFQDAGTDSNLTSKGNVGPYAVCAYSVQGVPEGQRLEVRISAQPSAFMPQVVPTKPQSDAYKGLITIPGGPCNKVAQGASSVSDLTSAWWTCGDYARNVNFGLYPPVNGSSGAPAPVTNRVAGPIRVAPGTPVQGTGPLMNTGAQRTMLAPQARPLLADGNKQSQGALNGGNRAAITGGIQPVGTPQVGVSQTMSAPANAPGGTPESLAAPAARPGSIAINRDIIQGYVLWNRNAFQYNPATVCQNMSMRLHTIGGSNPTIATDDHLLPISENVSPYAGCAYEVHGAPEGQHLQVIIRVQPSTLTPPQYGIGGPPSDDSKGPLVLSGAACTQTPPVKISVPYLMSGYWTCGDNVYNLNLILYPATSAGSPAPGTNRVAGPVRLAPGVAVESTGILTNSARQNQATLASPTKTTLLQQNQNSAAKADDLNPQPYPPKGINTSGAAGGAGNGRFVSPSKALKAKLGAAKKGPAIVNQAAASHVAAMATMLQNQRNSANKEAAQMMKLGIRPAARPNVSLGPSQTMSASTAASASQANRTAADAQIGAATQVTGPSNTQQMMKVSPVAVMENLALACSRDTTMRIVSVSGNEGPITFTTDPSGNFYTITGCSFGNAGSSAKVYIYKGGTFHEGFQIQEWNDNWIKLNLDPGLGGLLDQDDLTLVVQRADGQQAVKTGFKFYAARVTRLLQAIPQQDFALDKFTTSNVSAWVDSYTSPATDGFGGMTAEVSWNEHLQFVKGNFDSQDMPSAGTDIYNLSHLQPGFAPTAASISWRDMNCSDMGGTLVTVGNFGGNFNGSRLWITWPGENCKNVNCGFGDCFESLLTYGLDVWVEGPRCVDPWSGQAVHIGLDGKCEE